MPAPIVKKMRMGRAVAFKIRRAVQMAIKRDRRYNRLKTALIKDRECLSLLRSRSTL